MLLILDLQNGRPRKREHTSFSGGIGDECESDKRAHMSCSNKAQVNHVGSMDVNLTMIIASMLNAAIMIHAGDSDGEGL